MAAAVEVVASGEEAAVAVGAVPVEAGAVLLLPLRRELQPRKELAPASGRLVPGVAELVDAEPQARRSLREVAQGSALPPRADADLALVRLRDVVLLALRRRAGPVALAALALADLVDLLVSVAVSVVVLPGRLGGLQTLAALAHALALPAQRRLEIRAHPVPDLEPADSGVLEEPAEALRELAAGTPSALVVHRFLKRWGRALAPAVTRR